MYIKKIIDKKLTSMHVFNPEVNIDLWDNFGCCCYIFLDASLRFFSCYWFVSLAWVCFDFFNDLFLFKMSFAYCNSKRIVRLFFFNFELLSSMVCVCCSTNLFCGDNRAFWKIVSASIVWLDGPAFRNRTDDKSFFDSWIRTVQKY